MDLELLFLGTFKRGEFDKTEEAKGKSESGKIIKVFDGDVTTYLYELPSWYDEKNQEHNSELLTSLLSVFLADNVNNMGIKGSFDIVDNEIYLNIDYPSDDLVEYELIDDNADEFYFSYIKKSEQKFWLYHPDLISLVKGRIEDEFGQKYADEFLKEAKYRTI
jgi:hypothetical protein